MRRRFFLASSAEPDHTTLPVDDQRARPRELLGQSESEAETARRGAAGRAVSPGYEPAEEAPGVTTRIDSILTEELAQVPPLNATLTDWVWFGG
jgi:hypothetical protein